MARRYNKKDLEGEEKPTSGPVSFTSLIKFQPNSRKKNNNKPWRPMQLSDFADDEEDTQPSAIGDDGFSALVDDFSEKVKLESSRARASLLDLPPLQTNLSIKPSQDASEASSAYPREHSADCSSTNSHFGVVEDYARIFGKLPDPIRLHEEMGDFDGQIIFIGHPNRDVSAHQWSAPSFQWVNIGQYSHTRRKIEGSLASDRLRGLDPIHNTIEHFKAVAEQRETNIRENGRQEEQKSADPPSAPRVEALRLPDFADSAHVTSLPSASGPAGEQAPLLPRIPLPRVTVHVGSHAPTPTLRTVTRDYVDDPFISRTRVPYPAVPATLNFKGSSSGAVGLMDFDYEFPNQSADPRATSLNEQPPETSSQQLFIQMERERLGTIRRGIHPREHESQKNLREVNFGEEAKIGFGMPTGRNDLNRQPIPFSPEEVHNRQILKNKLAELGNSAYRPSLPVEARVAVPDVQGLQGMARTMFPPPGLTVANPHRVVSTLNANAAPYMSRSTTRTQGSGESESEITTVNVPQIANLHYSDPDGIRPPHVHKIANGHGLQPPTAQNWKGPFFTATMPTTHDPTASLSFQISEEEKLSNWFRDGQRPARQQEHARALMANADANPKNRTMKYFGAIGDASPRINNHIKYENTPAFIRLFENLSDHVEQSRAEVRTDYFTRAWKPARVSECDTGPDCNNSFFDESHSTSPRTQRAAHMPFQPYSGSSRGDGLASQRSRHASHSTHGVIAEGRFDGPNPSRY